jgi:hypothetical protein
MKMDMSAKPEMVDDELPKSNEGTYDQDELETMLRHFVEGKKIESDSKVLAMVRNYALSKNKMIEGLFKPSENKAPVNSLKDLKTKYNDKVMAEMKSGEAED